MWLPDVINSYRRTAGSSSEMRDSPRQAFSCPFLVLAWRCRDNAGNPQLGESAMAKKKKKSMLKSIEKAVGKAMKKVMGKGKKKSKSKKK
jgi:hypothetical protein